MLYYYLPKRAERPYFSYRLSILSFWGITFFYMWAGSHHLHYTALPHWVQNLGMTFSVDAAHSFLRASAGNALLTLGLAQGPRRRDVALYDGGGCLSAFERLEGSLVGDRPVNSLSTIPTGHRPRARRRARLGGADRLGSLTLGCALWKRRRMSQRFVEVHFWLDGEDAPVPCYLLSELRNLQGLMARLLR